MYYLCMLLECSPPAKELQLRLVSLTPGAKTRCKVSTQHYGSAQKYYADTLLFILYLRVRTSPAHTLAQMPHRTHADTLQSFLPAGSALGPPEPALGLPVFLPVSVKCIHMLLRGPRLEGGCFPSDKNHLAPSEESASRRSGAQWKGTVSESAERPLCHGLSVHRQERRTSHTWV